MRQPQALLKQYFGYDSFRPGQQVVVEQLLSGRDVLSVMPTGAGKSICFQIPALCLDGITLVVSPLISLMKDQVEGLIQAGIPAAYLNSSLTERQFGLALRNARMGKYKLIYVAPERLETASFLSFAQQAPISLLAVDEAHCVSQWGQDFRPSYLNIPAFLESLPVRPVVGAFTATATPEVRADIAARLALQDPYELVAGFDRPNLFWEVQSPRSKKEALLAFLRTRRNESGIIYCATRKTVDMICDFLQERGYSAARYHAGLDSEERRVNQERFVYGGISVMVATNAFGMGIDKPDVRYVVHYNMPKDLESCYQEAGRAGRDGDSAHCLLLYGAQDVNTNKFLIELRDENTDQSDEDYAQRVARDLERLKQMTFYCHTTDCLRRYILAYFGEESKSYCGSCANCLAHFQERDVTEDAQKILSCVKRMGERFGAAFVASVLRGARTERVLSLGLQTLPTFGVLSGLSQDEIISRIQLLTDEGYLIRQAGQYPTLSLGPEAGDILFRGKRLFARVKTAAAPTPRSTTQENVQVPAELYDALQRLRTKLARRAGVPAYVIFSNQTLREMCQVLPATPEELLRVSGVGEQKLQKYGDAFLEVLTQWQEQRHN